MKDDLSRLCTTVEQGVAEAEKRRERRRAEKELQESEDRFRSLIQNSSDLITVFTPDGTRSYISPSVERLLGYKPEDLIGGDIADLIHANDLPVVREALTRSMQQTREQPVFEARLRHADGTWCTFEGLVTNLLSDPAVGGVVINAHDITERKRAEERLQASEAQLRAVFGAMDELVFVLDEEGRYLTVTPTDPSLLYKPSAELIGKTLHELFPKKQADWLLGHVRRALGTRRRVKFEYELQIESCRHRFEANVSPMTEDMVVIVARDITARRKAEEQLRQLAQLLDLSHEAIFAWQPESGIVFWNQGCEKLYGFSKQEALGRDSHRLLKTVYPIALEQSEAALQTEGQWTGELIQTTRDGQRLTVESRWVLMQTEEGRLVLETNRDVTEQKKNAEALRESEERFRSAFESAAIGMALVGLDGRWLRVNQPLCDIVGYREEELLGLAFQDITHPEDLKADLELREKMLAGEVQRYQLEKRYLHKEGHPVWILLGVSLVQDDKGDPLYFISQIQDITGRKEAEEALTQSENRLRQIIDAEPECVKVLGSDGSLLEMNPAGLSMIEADSLEQVRGEFVYRYIAPEHRADFVALTQRVLRGGSGMLEFELVGRRGTRRWLETHAVPLPEVGDGTSGLLGITRDITERKKAEEALRESERLYRTVIEEAEENIFLVDVETARIVESNPASRETLGYTEEEFRRMTLYDIAAHDDESIRRNIRLTREKKRRALGQRKYRRKNGSHVDVEVSASTILYADRETLCVVAHDVTERAQAQQLLEERLAALSRIAARLTLDLSMQDTLDAMAESVVNVSTAVSCSVTLLDEECGYLHIEGSHGLSEEFKTGIEAVWRKGEVRSPTIEAIRTRQPTLASHMRRRMLENPLYKLVHLSIRNVVWDTVFIVPLVSRNRVLGAIDLSYLEGQEPSEDEKIFLVAVADQAAVAVENARLYVKARGKVALEERQRLARDLHDSVSQALYGIALGTKAARAALKHSPERADGSLDYVLASAEAGIAEMRALIFELRPESLEEEGLCAALEKQAAAVRTRHRLEVKTDLCEEPEASLQTKEAIYRIAQEALHNIVKHARATDVKLRLKCDAERILLEVSDDGIGFDPSGDFPGHLGLRSMRERAERLGGTLEVHSAPGKGTRVRACISTNDTTVNNY